MPVVQFDNIGSTQIDILDDVPGLYFNFVTGEQIEVDSDTANDLVASGGWSVVEGAAEGQTYNVRYTADGNVYPTDDSGVIHHYVLHDKIEMSSAQYRRYRTGGNWARTFVVTASAGAHGAISPSGAVDVDEDTPQTFVLTPASTYAVDDVLVDSVSVGAVDDYEFSEVADNHTISATFGLASHTITSSTGSNGTIAPLGAIPIVLHGDRTFTLTPDSHYHVADRVVDSVSQGAGSSYDFTNVSADHTIAASFAIDTNNIVSSTGSNGSISPLGTTAVDYGADRAYTITPSAHYEVDDVLVDSVSIGAETDYTFTNVIVAHTISTTFVIITHTITSSAGENGSIDPVGATVVNDGANQLFTFAADEGYSVSDILIDTVSIGPAANHTFTNVVADHTIEVVFDVTPP